MSVISFDQIQIDTLIDMMRCHHEDVVQILSDSPHFSHYAMRFYDFNKPVDMEQIAEKFIGRMLWYAVVSNKLAYALQYHDEINLNDIQVRYQKSTRSIICTKKQLCHELGHLLYNLTTNDGNKFIERKWYEPLETLYYKLSHFSAHSNI